MLLSKIAERSHYLPSEFCLMDGVTDIFQKSGSILRDAIAYTRSGPFDKQTKIQKMADDLGSQ